LLAIVVAVATYVAIGRPSASHPSAGAGGSALDRGSPSPSAGQSEPPRILPAQPLQRLPHGPTGLAGSPVVDSAPIGVPVRLQVPAIGIDTALESLDREPDGTLEPPTQWDEAGWYSAGVRPGEQGPAVIAGHVDSMTGPAVFYQLHQLRPGDAIIIRDDSGQILRFAVDTVRQYPKDSFPFDAVYGPAALPTLRLITCTGDFDWTTHNYLDNLVVSAHLIG
jgi:hypothetical protein